MKRALYREYRPTSFNEVVGQDPITTTLQNAIKKGNISHAYLFTGPRGVGKTSVARILAHEINGLDYDEQVNHLDIIEIDAASNRRIDEVRDLRDKVHIAPSSAKYKVYIIDEVHMLTKESFNALLKTLEEPPEHAIFILATTEAHKVPETIISRTQRFSFKPIEEGNAVDQLRSIAEQEKISIADDALELLAEHGQGSFRDSISMLDQITGFGYESVTKDTVSELLGLPNEALLEELLAAIVQSDSGRLFEALQSLREAGSQPALIARALISTLREQVIEKTTLLPIERTVVLMKELLPLTGAQSNFTALEIVLLESLIPSETESQAIVEDIEDKQHEEERVRSVVATEDMAPETDTASTPEEVAKPNADWQTVLNTVKETHNTLYGILRMADVKITDDTITMTFKFDFHEKQLKQQKHSDPLKRIIKETLGDDYQIKTEIVKDSKKTTPKPKKPAKSSDVKNVSNIFGGAELLES